MKTIVLALFLVLPFTIFAAEIGGTAQGFGYCTTCPLPTIQEQFVNDLGIKDAGVVVHWGDNGIPKRVSVLSPTGVPVQDICGTFLKYWPNNTTTVELYTTYMKRYPCKFMDTPPPPAAGGPASLDVATE